MYTSLQAVFAFWSFSVLQLHYLATGVFSRPVVPNGKRTIVIVKKNAW